MFEWFNDAANALSQGLVNVALAAVIGVVSIALVTVLAAGFGMSVAAMKAYLVDKLSK